MSATTVKLIDKNRNSITPFVSFNDSVVSDSGKFDAESPIFGEAMLYDMIDNNDVSIGTHFVVTKDGSLGYMTIPFSDDGDNAKVLNESGKYSEFSSNDFSVTLGEEPIIGVKWDNHKSNLAWKVIDASTAHSTDKYYLLGNKAPVSGTDGSLDTAVLSFRPELSDQGDEAAFVYFTGDCNMFHSSDERIKDIMSDIRVTPENLSEIRKIFFKFKGSDKVNVGVTAQSVQKVCPALVDTDANGILAVAYDKLAVLALGAIDTLTERINHLEKRISLLEK